MRCAAVRHVAFEDLGLWEAEIRAHGYEVQYLDVGVDDLAPAATADLTVVLGGPIGVGDQADFPALAEEIALIRRRLDADRPVIGVCLGAQLVAAALGARVAPGALEIGWDEVALTAVAADTPLRHLAGAPVLHWHGDAMDLPDGATLLASTAAARVQAFAAGSALALQFHAEVDGGAIEQWLIGHSQELRHSGIDVPALRARTLAASDAAAMAGVALIRDHLRGLDPR